MRQIKLKNEYVSLTVLPEVGGLITSLKYVPKGIELLYKHREPRPFYEWREDYPRLDGVHSFFTGGWFEVLPNAGYATEYAGEKWGLHGETPYLPWEVELNGREENTIGLVVALRRYPLKLARKISLENNNIVFKEVIYNLAPVELYFSWLHHPTFGGEFVDEHLRLEIEPVEFVVDRELGLKYSELDLGYRGIWPYAKTRDDRMLDLRTYPKRGLNNTNDLIYLPRVRDGIFKLTNDALGLTFEAHWDPKVFPTLWIWRALGGGPEGPWYGTIYATSVEITTSWPATGLADQVSGGTAAKIGPNQSISTELRFAIMEGGRR
jgi:hypothetical protein